MKVAFFLGGLNRGGAESLILDICRKHAMASFEAVCLYRKEGNYSNEFHAGDIPLLQLERKGGLLKYMYQLRRLLLRNNFDIVHAQTPSNAMLCFFCLFGTKIKIISTFHGHYETAQTWYLKIIYTFSEKVICVSKVMIDYYVKRLKVSDFNNKLELVYNGINFSKFGYVVKRTNMDVLNLCMVGSFNSGRSHALIIEALHLLKQRKVLLPGVRFSFIGGGYRGEEFLFESCKELVHTYNLEDVVCFLGMRQDVPELLMQMDGFVYSSVSDTFGIAVVEAMAAGLPVIVNDWEVMREITNDGAWATLYRSNDAEDCADKIDKLIHELRTNREQVMQRCESIAHEVRAKFSIENHIRQLEQIYNSLS